MSTGMRRLLRIVKIFLLGLVALILTLALAITLFFSQPRLHLWLFSQLDSWTGGVVSVERSEGHIFDRIHLYGVAVRHPALSLDIDHLDWRLDLFNLWYGRLTLEHLHIHEIDVVLHELTPREPQPPNPEPFAALLAIPLLIELDDVRAETVRLSRGEQHHLIEAFHTSMAWQVRRLVVEELGLRYEGHRLSARARTTIHDSSRFSGRLAVRVDSETLPPVDLRGRWRGTLQALDFTLNTEAPLHLRSQHRLTMPADAPLTLHSRWQELDYPLDPRMTLRSTKGQLALTFDEQLALEGEFDWQLTGLPEAGQYLSVQFDGQDRLDFHATTGFVEAGELRLEGWAELAGQRLQAHLLTRELVLAAFVPDLNIGYSGEAVLQLENFTDPQVVLTLDQTRVEMPEYDAALRGGLTMAARDLLGEAARPRADLVLQDLDVRQGQHQVRLNGPLQLQQLDPDRQQWRVDTVQLRMDYLDYQARLQVRADFDPAPQVQLHRLQLDVGENRLTASGHYAEQVKLELSARLNRLEQLLPMLAGRLELDAALQGPLAALHAELRAQGSRLVSQDTHLGALQLDLTVPLHQPWRGEFGVELARLVRQPADAAPVTLIDTLVLSRRPHQETMRTVLQLRHPDLAVRMQLADQADGLEAIRATLQQLHIDSRQSGPWTLQQHAALHWPGGHRLESDPICLRQTGLTAVAPRLCLQGEGDRLHWQMQRLPVFAWLGEWLPEGLLLEGLIEGQGELVLGEQPASDWTVRQQLGSSRIDVLLIQQTHEVPLRIAQWQLHAEADAAGARVHSEALLNETGRVAAAITLDNRDGVWSEAGLAGSLDAHLQDLALPEDLLSLFALHEQRLHLHSRLGGTLGAPEYQSGAELEALLDLPLLGLFQQQLWLRAELDEAAIVAQGRLRQPEQRGLDLTARLEGLQAGVPVADVRLQASDMQLLNGPFATLRGATDLRLHLANGALTLEGDTHLHHSRIDLQRIPLAGRTRVSADEVLVDSEGRPLIEEDTAMPVYLDVTIGFGEEVLILLSDVHAYLGGALTLRKSPGEELRGSGRVSLDRGAIQLDPRNRIQIDYSTFSFIGPLGNPTLDVQLSRQVEHIQANLNITGTATQPQFVFYSTPSLSQGNIINIMIFGRAVDVAREPDYESQLLSALYKFGLHGNAPVLSQITNTLGIHDVYFDIQDEHTSNLILGRALTNRLYIRYAMGLSDQQSNAVQMFYQLGRRWVLESRSGEDHQSLDLIWTHER